MGNIIQLSPALQDNTGDKIHRLPGVKHITGLSRSSIYAGVKNGSFPAPLSLGERAVGWLDSEIMAWVQTRKVTRQQVAA